MKVRQGFVSNSSSSSFVIFASKEVFDAVLADLNDLQKKVANLFISESETFLGREVMSYSYCSGNNGDYYYEQVEEVVNSQDENGDDENESLDEMVDFAFDEFEKLIEGKAKEMGEGVLTDSQDW